MISFVFGHYIKSIINKKMENFKEELEKLISERINKLTVEKKMSYNQSIIREIDEKLDLLFDIREALFGF
jgi:hypothetical protein